MTRFAIAGVLIAVQGAAAQVWWWPPTDGMAVEPGCIGPATPIQITLSGQWPSSCRPNVAQVTVNGDEIDFLAIRDPAPVGCLAVITNWSLTGSTGPLPVGTYHVYATYQHGGQPQTSRELLGSFFVEPACASECYANCDASTIPPVLNVADFTCFLNLFAGGDSRANCDGSTTAPILNVADFTCFLNAFAAGCS
jgi:hypothetical protein